MRKKKRICIDCGKLYSSEQFVCPICREDLRYYYPEHNGILVDEPVVANVRSIKKPRAIFLSWIVLSFLCGSIVFFYDSIYLNLTLLTGMLIYSLVLLKIIHPDKDIYSRSWMEAPSNWKGGGKNYYYTFLWVSLVLAGLFYLVDISLILEGGGVHGYALSFALLFDFLFTHHLALYYYFIGKYLAYRKGEV